jgi:hypothetical protein
MCRLEGAVVGGDRSRSREYEKARSVAGYLR